MRPLSSYRRLRPPRGLRCRVVGAAEEAAEEEEAAAEEEAAEEEAVEAEAEEEGRRRRRRWRRRRRRSRRGHRRGHVCTDLLLCESAVVDADVVIRPAKYSLQTEFPPI